MPQIDVILRYVWSKMGGFTCVQGTSLDGLRLTAAREPAGLSKG